MTAVIALFQHPAGIGVMTTVGTDCGAMTLVFLMEEVFAANLPSPTSDESINVTALNFQKLENINMFAVKGWSLDAATLKPQTEVIKSSKSAGAIGEKKQGRKRKRGEEKPARHEDVEKLWDEHIEGKEPVKTKSAKRKEKKQKKDGQSSTGHNSRRAHVQKNGTEAIISENHKPI